MGHIQYELDGEDRIRSVNASWSTFARENGAEQLAHGVVGTPIWDWVAGGQVRHLYRLLFSRIRETGGDARIPFRCDSPGTRRFMELEVSALPDRGLRCTARLEREEQRTPVPLLDLRAPRCEDLLRICSWCKKVRTEQGLWLEVERAIAELRLVEDEAPTITHTICTDCESLLDDPG